MSPFLPQPGALGKPLAPAACNAHMRAMWDEPYLETCCRAALHRLTLAGPIGRPPGLKDGPCLRRLTEMGLARLRADGRYDLTASGVARHATDVLRRAAPPVGADRGRRA